MTTQEKVDYALRHPGTQPGSKTPRKSGKPKANAKGKSAESPDEPEPRATSGKFMQRLLHPASPGELAKWDDSEQELAN